MAKAGAANPSGALGQTQPCEPSAAAGVGDVLNHTLNKTDAFLQRKKQKRRAARGQHGSHASVSKFQEKRALYQRGEEQLWDLMNRIEELKDLKRQKDESNFA